MMLNSKVFSTQPSAKGAVRTLKTHVSGRRHLNRLSPQPHLNQPDPGPWRSEVSRLEAGYSVDWAAKSRRMAVCHGHWPYRGLADHRRPR